MSTTNIMSNEIVRTEHNGMRELTPQEIQAVSGGYKIETATYTVGLGLVVRWGARLGPKGALLAAAAYTVGFAIGYTGGTSHGI